ncbi:MAG: YHS domain-containing protein [Bacillota bacterium]
MAKDPVCGQEVKSGSSPEKSSFQGSTYFFCSKQCRSQFESNPSLYSSKKGFRG